MIAIGTRNEADTAAATCAARIDRMLNSLCKVFLLPVYYGEISCVSPQEACKKGE